MNLDAEDNNKVRRGTTIASFVAKHKGNIVIYSSLAVVLLWAWHFVSDGDFSFLMVCFYHIDVFAGPSAPQPCVCFPTILLSVTSPVLSADSRLCLPGIRVRDLNLQNQASYRCGSVFSACPSF